MKYLNKQLKIILKPPPGRSVLKEPGKIKQLIRTKEETLGK